MPNLTHAIHDVKHDLRPQRFSRAHESDQWIREKVRSKMGSRDVVKCSVRKILQGPSDSRSRVVFHRGHVDDFCYFLCHHGCHVRSSFPLAEKTGLAINAGLIAGAAAHKSVLDPDDPNASWQ